MLNAASRVGEASHRVLTTIGDEDEETREMQDTLLGKRGTPMSTRISL